MAGRGASRFSRGALRHEGGGGCVADCGGAPCWALLPPGLGWLGLNVIEDVLGGSGSRCRRGAGLGLGLGFGCGLRPRRADGFEQLRGGGLEFRPSCGRVCLGGGGGLVGACALAAAGLLAVGTGLGARLGGFPRSLGGGVLDEDVVVLVVDEVVVVVEVVESEAEQRAVEDGGGPWAAGAGAGCWVLRVVRPRVRVQEPGVCARFPW